MNQEIAKLEPNEIWSHFCAINAVPRASKKEHKIIAFMKRFGEQLGLPVKIDAVGNVLITKEATADKMHAPTIVMQSHLDMVHQKNSDTLFDFDTQGIDMYIDGEWVKARGTTLGADNGMGVAAIMAILESKEISHPKIEALFTIDEETGMTGALGLQAGFLSGKILLNLDTEDDDEIDIGCAGGLDVSAFKAYPTIVCPLNYIGLKIKVSGLKGGHSGMDINKGLGNANKILNQILISITAEEGAMISRIDGGNLRNAIPREAYAILSIHPELKKDILTRFDALVQDLKNKYIAVDPDLNITVEDCDNPITAMDPIEESKFLKAINEAHNGVYHMSKDIPDLVETSNNVAKVEVVDGTIKVLNLSRSSVQEGKSEVAHQLKDTFESAEFDVLFSGEYPGWTPNPKSKILEILKSSYIDLFKHEPRVVACHAGLECGIIGKHYPEMEMISFGPTIKGAHSPDERVNIASVNKFWHWLKVILASIE